MLSDEKIIRALAKLEGVDNDNVEMIDGSLSSGVVDSATVNRYNKIGGKIYVVNFDDDSYIPYIVISDSDATKNVALELEDMYNTFGIADLEGFLSAYDELKIDDYINQDNTIDYDAMADDICLIDKYARGMMLGIDVDDLTEEIKLGTDTYAFVLP